MIEKLKNFINKNKLKCEKSRLYIWLYLDFNSIQEFVNIVGKDIFGVYGVECVLKDDCIAVDLDNFFENEFIGDDNRILKIWEELKNDT